MDTSLRQQFLYAGPDSDLPLIESLIKQGLTLEDIRSENNFGLQYASLLGNYKLVELLINQGLTLDDIRSKNNYSLQNASKNGHYDVVELLVYQGLTEEEVKEALKDDEKGLLFALSLFGGKATKAAI